MIKLPILTCAEKPEAYGAKNHELKVISLKSFQYYFRGLLQLMNIFQHVQCR